MFKNCTALAKVVIDSSSWAGYTHSESATNIYSDVPNTAVIYVKDGLTAGGDITELFQTTTTDLTGYAKYIYKTA